MCVSKTHKVLSVLTITLRACTARPWQQPQTSAATWLIPLNNQFSHQCFCKFGLLFQTWPSVCVVSLLTYLMLLMGSLIKCGEGVQLKRGIDKQSS